EFRRTSKSISRGMAVSFGLAVAFAAAIVYAFESVVGMDFLNGSVALSTWFFEGGSDPRILPFASGLTALPNFVAGGNPILLGIMFLGSVSWYILWLILGLYIFSRYALSFSIQMMSYGTIIIVFVGGAIWYFGARAFHLRRHGVDISMAFKELPPD